MGKCCLLIEVDEYPFLNPVTFASSTPPGWVTHKWGKRLLNDEVINAQSLP